MSQMHAFRAGLLGSLAWTRSIVTGYMKHVARQSGKKQQ